MHSNSSNCTYGIVGVNYSAVGSFRVQLVSWAENKVILGFCAFQIDVTESQRVDDSDRTIMKILNGV